MHAPLPTNQSLGPAAPNDLWWNMENTNRTETEPKQKQKQRERETLGNTKRSDGQQLKICWTCRAAGHKLKFRKMKIQSNVALG